MKCPECSRNAISFGKTMLLFDPRRIECGECDARLKLSHQWVSTFWISIIAVIIISLFHVLFEKLLSFDNTAIYFITLVAVVFCYDIIFWQFATYEVIPTEKTDS